MKIDVHITTCHRTDVHCRPRPHEGDHWNVRPWTPEERLNISKYSVESILRFFNHPCMSHHDIRVTLLDDGSNRPEVLDWFDEIDADPRIRTKYFRARGSAAGINDHISALPDNVDYIMHIEDDHILFNPESIDIFSLIDSPDYQKYSVFTLRSGLPTCITDSGWNGAWGPVSFNNLSREPVMEYKQMGNAHHIVKFDKYKDMFIPLHGNTGGCEADMNRRIKGLNAEIQVPVHAFHSHLWESEVTNTTLNSWHQSGEGIEVGIKNMHEYLLSKKDVSSQLHMDMRTFRDINHTDYAY